MIIREILSKGISILKDAGLKAPAMEAGVMLCEIMNCGREYLYAHGDEPVDDNAVKNYSEMLKRRAEGMPFQYITGHCEFMALDFVTNPGVLIPRQDTETLVETVIDISRQYNRTLEILDVGTGTGCIAVSLAHYIEDCFVTASDISAISLKTARLNSIKNGTLNKMRFIKSNLFDELDGVKYDIIVSNPPYIRKPDIKKLQTEIREHEPYEALDGGEDGLDFYRAIAEKAPEFLKPKSYLALEVGLGQSEAVMELLGGSFGKLKAVRDISGISRVVMGELGERG